MISISFLLLMFILNIKLLNGKLNKTTGDTTISSSLVITPLMTNSTNIINELVIRQEHIVEYILLPFIFLVGTICNFLTFLVMRRKKMRHQSTYFYMAVLAVADQMVLLVGCLNYWFYLFMNINITIYSDYICKIASASLYGMFHFCVWIVVIMTIERYIAVALPLQASRLCTVKRAKLYTSILASIIFLINMHFLISHSVFEIPDLNQLGCQPKEDYKFLMSNIWPWIDASVYSFIPLTLLIIFNILIVHNLIKASKNIEKLNNTCKKFNINKDKKTKSFYLVSFVCLGCCCCSNNNNNNNKEIEISGQNYKHVKSKSLCQYENKIDTKLLKSKSMYHQSLMNHKMTTSASNLSFSSSTVQNSQTNASQSSPSSTNRRLTIMLLVVSVTFFITSTPIVTLQTIEQASFVSKQFDLNLIRGIFLVLQYLNHSCNFFLYAVTGKTFRREFFALFKKPASSKNPNLLNKLSTTRPAHLNSNYNSTSLMKQSNYNHNYSINKNDKYLFNNRKSNQIQI
ncbi:unnamed protein product [Brachionus calyciflorus]|uniref:G-protein coupled receptors family 1 profile domain-containing protein n=1 Tax=Brachionus calyciflorus TaxID=104777 RepID=A0A813QH59_9BILA|nr:unnamed protein product [Brachionus calyciflorus]